METSCLCKENMFIEDTPICDIFPQLKAVIMCTFTLFTPVNIVKNFVRSTTVGLVAKEL